MQNVVVSLVRRTPFPIEGVMNRLACFRYQIEQLEQHDKLLAPRGAMLRAQFLFDPKVQIVEKMEDLRQVKQVVP